ncbi:MAG: ammonium transporter [Gemmataceae bacterium]|nr:ammonium transporter [Gemmataceae bacterium]
MMTVKRALAIALVVLSVMALTQGAPRVGAADQSMASAIRVAQAPKDEPKSEEGPEKIGVLPAEVKEAESPLDALKKELETVKTSAADATARGDIAWMLVSSALVMFMVPGLALFYAGMVRGKNVLATMMQSMVALAIVGVFWVAIGYCLAFGETRGGFIGWSPEKLLFLKGVEATDTLAGTNIPVYLHVMFQGMFAIITPALISGALAERIKFGPYCLFILLWVTLVYCPLAHMVWAMNWWGPVEMLDTVNGVVKTVTKDPGTMMVGFMGKNTLNGGLGALDFAGGTVVHIAAGLSALGSILVVRKRLGYPEHAMHPNSMVLTLLGAGLLWFGWFGFNGGSAMASTALAVSAFSATQAAAAAAGLSWMIAEWLHKGKPTALGLASGIVAGLVAVTPASGFVYIWGGLAIGLIAGIVCYGVVCLKPVFKYDDSLDVFGVHGVGGFLGAVLTGVFCYVSINSAGADGLVAKMNKGATGPYEQVIAQLKAAALSAALAFVASIVLTKVIDVLFGFITDAKSEIDGLDRSEHGEVGFDYGPGGQETSRVQEPEPRSAAVPPDGKKRFAVVINGADHDEIMSIWSKLCQAGPEAPSPRFKSIYPYMTLVKGNRFQFRGGDPKVVSENLRELFQEHLSGYSITSQLERSAEEAYAGR